MVELRLDDEGHVAKGEAQVFSHDDPVVVATVETVTVLETKLRVLDGFVESVEIG